MSKSPTTPNHTFSATSYDKSSNPEKLVSNLASRWRLSSKLYVTHMELFQAQKKVQYRRDLYSLMHLFISQKLIPAFCHNCFFPFHAKMKPKISFRPPFFEYRGFYINKKKIEKLFFRLISNSNKKSML